MSGQAVMASALTSLSARGRFIAKQLKQLELKDESMSTNENPLGGRGRSEEERWARQQQQEAIEKMKKAGTAGKDAGKPGDQSAVPASAPAPAAAPKKDSKK
jgi:hypothetical protein